MNKTVLFLIIVYAATGCSKNFKRDQVKDKVLTTHHLYSKNNESEKTFINEYDKDFEKKIIRANQNIVKIRVQEEKEREKAYLIAKAEEIRRKTELEEKKRLETQEKEEAKRLAREEAARRRIERQKQTEAVVIRDPVSHKYSDDVGTSVLKAEKNQCIPSKLIGAAENCNIKHTFTNPSSGAEIDVTIDMAYDISGVYEICARDINFPEDARTYELNSDGTGYLEFHGKGEPKIDIEWGVLLKEGNVVPAKLFIRGDQHKIYQIIYTQDNGKLGFFNMYNLDGEPVINGPASFAMKRGCY